MQMEEVKQDSVRAWILAARPKTLTAALIPVVAATALASADARFQAIPALLCAVFASLMQIASNLINDLYDFQHGNDRSDRLGPERACAQGWISVATMRRGILLTLAAACLSGSFLLFYGGWWLIGIGAACVVFAFLYTTLLASCGLGDLLVLVFFGFVPVLGTYYVQVGTFTAAALWCGLACGLVIDTLLVVNNYRDRDADKVSGKKTLIVWFGEPFGRYFYLMLGLAACLCASVLSDYGYGTAGMLPLLYLLPHVRTWKRMTEIRNGRALNGILAETSRNMFIFALLLAIGLLL